MKNFDFNKVVQEKFKFLEKVYNCRCIKSIKENWGCKVIYINETTGVKITYEYREAYIFITLYKLLNGVLIENPGVINEDTLLYGFDLDDIINISNPTDLIKPTYEYSNNSVYHNKNNGFKLYISDFAKNLEKYGNDVLSGNFEIFKEIEIIVKKRAKLNDRFSG